MKEIDRIKGMTAKQLAKFLIISKNVDTEDESFDGDFFTITAPGYATPYGDYPYWKYDEVVEDLVKILEGEERDVERREYQKTESKWSVQM